MRTVPHQACTLATGALRSSFTIKVRPSGSTHFLAVFGGKVTSIESLTGAAFRLTILKTNAQMIPVTVMRYTIYCLFDPRLSRSVRSRNFRRWQARTNFYLFFRRERLHKRLLKVVNILEIFDRVLIRLPKNSRADEIEDHVPDVFSRMDAPVLKHCQHHRSKFF